MSVQGNKLSEHCTWNLDSKQLFRFSEPTYKNDLIAGFHAIKGNEINYLDITNEGLKLDVNPGPKAMEFWSRLENQAQRLVEEKVKQT